MMHAKSLCGEEGKDGVGDGKGGIGGKYEVHLEFLEKGERGSELVGNGCKLVVGEIQILKMLQLAQKYRKRAEVVLR